MEETGLTFSNPVVTGSDPVSNPRLLCRLESFRDIRTLFPTEIIMICRIKFHSLRLPLSLV